MLLRRNVSSSLKYISLLALAAVASACFKNPGDVVMPVFNVAIPVSPVYDAANLVDSYLRATGSCNGNTSIMFTYFSNLASSQSQEVQCSNDKIDAHLPVLQGDKAQIYTVQMVAKLRNNKSPVLTVTVNYNPPPSLTPGFAILSGGGISTHASGQINAAIGEILDPATVTGTGTLVRTGVNGVNDP